MRIAFTDPYLSRGTTVVYVPNGIKTEQWSKFDQNTVKMSGQWRALLPLLKRIMRMKPAKQKAYLKSCENKVINCFSECARNILKGKVKLKQSQFTRLKRYRKNVHKLADRRTSLKVKRQVVNQKGGFVSSLLIPAISALGWCTIFVMSQCSIQSACI